MSFPGRSCPGLIEAGLPGRGLAARLEFPGRSCPGLIEAKEIMRIKASIRYISGAKLPRPH